MRLLVILGFASGIGIAIGGCTPPPPDAFSGNNKLSGDGDDDETGRGDSNDVVNDDLTPSNEKELPPPTDASCNDECPADAKRCSTTSTSGTEICQRATDGCLRWAQGEDCATDTTCDKAKNDGSCQAGCVNDAGCSVANSGQRRCSVTTTAEQTCTKVGACFLFKTTRSNIPQQCISSNPWCASGQRYTCVASPAGACTQHLIQQSPCSSGTSCQGAGQCLSTCVNDVGCSASNVNATKCNPEGGRSRLRCALSGSCYKWLTTTSCAPDEKCSSGSCVFNPPACTNACTSGSTRCKSATTRESCVVGASGCTVWQATTCAPSHLCSGGICMLH